MWIVFAAKYWREIIIVFLAFIGHIFGRTQLQNWSAKRS